MNIINTEKNIFPITTPMITDVKVCGLGLKAALSEVKKTPIVNKMKNNQLIHATGISALKSGIKLKTTSKMATTKERPESWLKKLCLAI